MTDQRLTPADLANALARRGSLPRRYCEDFVRSFFEIIEEGLVHDNLVKIKGFGTFKVVDIDARESVDVNTGARIEIASHTKVSFTPDAALRDAVNKPFLAFQTVVINEGTDVQKMEAIEEEAAEPQVEEPVAAEPVAAEPVAAEPVAAEPVVTEPVAEVPVAEEPVAEEPVAEEPVVEEPAVEEPIAEEPVAEEPVAEQPAVAEPVAEKPATEAPAAVAPACEKSCRCHCWCHTLIGVLLALFFTALGYCLAYYWRPVELPELKFECEQPEQKDAQAAPAAAAENQKAEPIAAESTAAAVAPAAAQNSKKPSATASYPQLEGGDYWIVGELGTEKMTAGKTLLNMALKYYKNKDLFVYICTMNDITNPDIVPLDKELRIPELKDKKTGMTPQEVADAAKNKD